VRDLGRRLAERFPFAEKPGAVKVSGEIAVAEIEPGRLAEADHLAEGAKGLVAEAPASSFVDEAAQRIADGVEVGRDVEPQTSASSPVLPMMPRVPGSTSASRPLRSLAAPVPPARATRRMTGG
jgi:hypothetical protein